MKHDVAFVPGASFFPNSAKKNTFRLNYSNMPKEKILEGMKRIGEVLEKTFKDGAVLN
ncbi:hypothetical protein QS257_05995 [Terrilactibacillus sp. S3-3]|nr:hypothetical protein QS257_05995 [Terrilactibacillus sp. S3-3]